MTATITTYLEGRVQTVPADDPRLAAIEAHRQLCAHVANLRRLALPERRMYLDNIERRQGAEARAALEAAYKLDWEARRQAPTELEQQQGLA